MNHKKSLALGAAFLGIASIHQVHSQALTSSSDFLLMTPGARPAAMGQAFSAVGDDINSLSFNPAGLASVALPEVGYDREEFIAGINYDFAAAAVPLGDIGVIGISYMDMGSGTFDSTGGEAPAVSAGDTALSAAWAKTFDKFQAGAAVKYISQQADTLNATDFAVDLGLRYALFPDINLAGSMMNLGPNIQFGSSEPLPTQINLGASWKAVDTSINQISLAGEAFLNTTTQTQYYGMGAEYWFKNTLALRAGYLANSQDQGFSGGAGINLGFLEVDYAYQPFNILGSVNRFSATFRWDGPWGTNGNASADKGDGTSTTALVENNAQNP